MQANEKKLTCIVVTPEKAVLNEPADFVAVPMFDGELGILPGKTPVIGRLGAGELRVVVNNHPQRFFVDGGFLQVRSNVVTLLTSRAVPAEEISLMDAEQLLEKSKSAPGRTEHEQAEKTRVQNRARAMIRIAKKNLV